MLIDNGHAVMDQLYPATVASVTSRNKQSRPCINPQNCPLKKRDDLAIPRQTFIITKESYNGDLPGYRIPFPTSHAPTAWFSLYLSDIETRTHHAFDRQPCAGRFRLLHNCCSLPCGFCCSVCDFVPYSRCLIQRGLE